jgi:hypothetical protein
METVNHIPILGTLVKKFLDRRGGGTWIKEHGTYLRKVFTLQEYNCSWIDIPRPRNVASFQVPGYYVRD